jgi:5-methylthioribose kinase
MVLKLDNVTEIESYLKDRKWINESDTIIKVEKPGDGNMNFTLRVYVSSGKTCIIKQSKEFVEKYPSIAAPANRSIIEGKFYEFTHTNLKLKAFMPSLIGLDEVNNIIALQELGASSDFSFLYRPDQKIEEMHVVEIIAFLNELHGGFRDGFRPPIFENKGMRILNHEHIFVYPFMEENGFDLNDVLPGLQKEAFLFKRDNELKSIILKLGELYLSDGPCLLHGDFYPASFLKTEMGIKIIDSEFCFFGFAEFDLGVFIAHLKLSGQSQEIIDLAYTSYEKREDFNMKLLNQFVGIEILRRIIGLAQLPLTSTLQTRVSLCKEAKELLMNP